MKSIDEQSKEQLMDVWTDRWMEDGQTDGLIEDG